MLKRVGLFLIVNFLVITTISILFSIFNIQPYLTDSGLNVTSLLIFCLLWGMIGSFISLLLSKKMAKWMMGVEIIDPKATDPRTRPLLDMVERLAKEAGLPVCPEVGIYNSPEVNAFATGPSKRNSLVAVSSGLLKRMKGNQIEGVIAHELAHISNGDMVTMTLLQGVINAFVMFAARIIAMVVVRAMRGDREGQGSYGFAYYGIVMLLQMVLMLLGSIVIAAFSRWREFHADAGGARVAGKEKMIAALEGLQQLQSIKDPQANQEAFQALKISSGGAMAMMFATHPPLEKRIQRLREAA
jgi:heat shock protein HtpX